MKTNITYQLEESDPSLKYIDEAFHRVPFYTLDEFEQKAINRLRDGQLTSGDPPTIIEGLFRAGELADERSGQHEEPIAEGIRQAAENCRQAAKDFKEWFATARMS